MAAGKNADAERDFPLPANAGPPAPPREWNGHLLNPCGDCDKLGVMMCLTTHYLPCVTFGRTANRAFAMSALKAGMLFASLLCVSYAHRAMQVALVVNDCVAKSEPGFFDGEQHGVRRMGPGFHHVHPEHHGGVRLRCAKPFGAPLDPERMHAERCAGLVDTAVTLNIATLVAISLLVALGATLRGAMRKRYGIPGSWLKDNLAWCCCMPCAMCQEARTMAVNNVEAGVWRGRTQELAQTLPATAAPSAPVMYYEPVKPAQVEAAAAAAAPEAAAAAPEAPAGKADSV